MQSEMVNFAPGLPPGKLDKTGVTCDSGLLVPVCESHLQNQKYITYCIVVRRWHVQKNWWNLDVWFL